MKPGIHDGIPAELYHEDPGATPSLSASMATLLLTKTPAHAKAAHPRLNPKYERKDEKKYDFGNAVHVMLLENDPTRVAPMLYDNWRTKASQEEREVERSYGRIPLLVHEWERVQELVGAVREWLAQFEDGPVPLTDGKPEQTLIWEDQGVLCRARPDWLRDDYTTCDDVKSTTHGADPKRWTRRALFEHGCDLQAVMYGRGIKALTGEDAIWRWIVIETEPPYAASAISPAPDVLAYAENRLDRALAIWKQCLATDTWPAYPPRTCYAELPPWLEAQWLEQEAREEVAA